MQIYEVKLSLLRNKDGRMGEVRRTIYSTEGKKGGREGGRKKGREYSRLSL